LFVVKLPSGSKERVTAIDVGLKWDTGAPLPHLLQSEQRTFLVFYLQDATTPWDGTTVQIMDASSSEAYPVGVIEWLWCAGAVLGSPNDEVFHGHRLWKKGLSDVGAYAAGEVIGSRWIDEMDEANRVHRKYRGSAPSAQRHFILGFHDSTFECVAEGFKTWTTVASMPEVILSLAQLLDSRDEPTFSSGHAQASVRKGWQ
jgi:hypothetical protein